jgi:hypothetical protein
MISHGSYSNGNALRRAVDSGWSMDIMMIRQTWLGRAFAKTELLYPRTMLIKLHGLSWRRIERLDSDRSAKFVSISSQQSGGTSK